MLEIIKIVKKFIFRMVRSLIPQHLLYISDPESYSIHEGVKNFSSLLKYSDNILDAGAGKCPYRKYFSDVNYEATDFENVFNAADDYNYDFICSLDNIPKDDNSYDAILNTQVLEHVEYPQKVIDEFYRILKPNGKLFLVAPQGWGIHGAPYHYFNFTKYGLESLFKNSGFKIIYIKERGGYFWYLAKRLKDFPVVIFSQYRKSKFYYLFYPLFVILNIVLGFIIPILFFYLDKFDKKKDFTLGYSCYCIKEVNNG